MGSASKAPPDDDDECMRMQQLEGARLAMAALAGGARETTAPAPLVMLAMAMVTL
jgi:hypothetical protein